MFLLATTLLLAVPQEARVTLTGTVIDTRGDPVPAVEVWVEPSIDEATVLGRSRTDGEGVFFVAVKPVVGPLRIHARGSGNLQGFAWAAASC